MKKILFGLIAVSAISFAAEVDLGATPTDGTNVFQTLQEGAISVTGKVTSDIPVIKYVVYASDDNGVTKEDVLQLNDFVISHDSSLAGFKEENPKVYVKRVTGTTGQETVEELNSVEEIEFMVCLDSSKVSSQSSWFGTSASFSTTAFELLVQDELNAVIAAVNSELNTSELRWGNKGFTVTDVGNYRGGKDINFSVTEKGVLEITNGNNNETGLGDRMQVINKQFAGGKDISTNVKIAVRVR